MDLHEFKRMLQAVATNPPPDGSGGQRWDAARWCKAVAKGVAERMDSYGGTGNIRLPKSWRTDTATGLFENQLRHVMAQDYDRPYPGLMARGLMASASGIPAGAETVVQRGFDITGRPELVVSDARDIPRVSLQATQSVSRVVGLAIKWGINYDEMLAAAMAGVDLDGKGLTAARTVQEREIDLLLSTGDAQYGIIGCWYSCSPAPRAWSTSHCSSRSPLLPTVTRRSLLNATRVFFGNSTSPLTYR